MCVCVWQGTALCVCVAEGGMCVSGACACMSMHVCVRSCVRACVFVWQGTVCVCLSVCMAVYCFVCACVFVCLCARACVCVRVHVRVCVCGRKGGTGSSLQQPLWSPLPMCHVASAARPMTANIRVGWVPE